MADKKSFGSYELYTISSGELTAEVITLGAVVRSLKLGEQELVLGHTSPEDYLADPNYMGAVLGRYANRIGGACVEINGVKYELDANENGNTLHGGFVPTSKMEWTVDDCSDSSVKLSLTLTDGQAGFPGNITMSVTYTVSGKTLEVKFEGLSDKDTFYSPTCHPYFNFGGTPDVRRAKLQVNAKNRVEPGPGLIPTGAVIPADGVFDFKTMRTVTQNYDDCFVLSGTDACTLEMNGIVMKLKTDFPAVQIYTGEFIGGKYKPNNGLAVEPEFFPDSPNHPNFPSTLLRAGEHFVKTAEYSFEKI